MRRAFSLLVAVAILAACAGGEAESRSTSVVADTAPDFMLDLGGGGTFVLSEEARPVFMVFWAEW